LLKETKGTAEKEPLLDTKREDNKSKEDKVVMHAMNKACSIYSKNSLPYSLVW
jgi:hypothetical protein